QNLCVGRFGADRTRFRHPCPVETRRTGFECSGHALAVAKLLDRLFRLCPARRDVHVALKRERHAVWNIAGRGMGGGKRVASLYEALDWLPLRRQEGHVTLLRDALYHGRQMSHAADM